MKKEKRKKPMLTFFFLAVLSLGGLLSCGLEAFYYIDFIQRIDYRDTSAALNLPSSSQEGYAYFDNFIIFYRIYISAEPVNTGPQLEIYDSSNERNTINSTLNSDFRGLYSLTNTTSTDVSTSNLENTFYNRRYFLLTLEDADINSVLGSGSLGRTLDIAFPPNDRPTLTVNGASYDLQRAVEPPAGQTLVFVPQPPNLYFLNHPDLYDNAKAYPNVSNINADVAAYTGSGTPRYTYVSMYIAARGTSLEMPPRTIYSQPTFIGIFRLANSG